MVEGSILLNWQCNCGVVYGLERNVPTVLHKNHPERKTCNKTVGKNVKCGTKFPDQAKRDELFRNQNIFNEEE
jgi:hypothetical protein